MKTLEVLDHVLKGKKIAPSTRREYINILHMFAEFSEEWPTRGVVIDEYLNSLPKLQDSTILTHFKLLNSAGKYMNDKYDLPLPKATRPTVKKKMRRYFTPQEMMTIIVSCAANEEDKTLTLMLIDSSCRIGEVSGLDNSHVGINFIDVSGKTGERRYRCNPEICATLKKIGEGKPAIFMNQYGTPATPAQLAHRMTKIIKRAGLTGHKLGAHTFRHSAAHLVAVETGSALAVKALLQHDDINTGKTYMGDAEMEIQQGVSPLQLMNTKLGLLPDGSNGQLALGQGEIITTVQPLPSIYDHIIDVLELEYQEVPADMGVRPLLKSKDLELIRRAFIAYTKTRISESDNILCVNLFKRMLRRAK